MVLDLEKPRVAEIQVQMDCYGCVQRIKNALQGIYGVYEVDPNVAQQKLTVIGWADLETTMKAIRKARKIATIWSNSEPPEEAAQPTDPPSDGGSAAPETVANPPTSETPAAKTAPQPEAIPLPEPPKDQPPPALKPAPPAAETTDDNANDKSTATASQQPQPQQPSVPKDVGEVHLISHHPPDYGHRYGYLHSYGGPSSPHYPNSHVFRREPPQSATITLSNNTYKPSPYVTEYKNVSSPPRYTHYRRIDHYNEDYHNNYSNGGSCSDSDNNSNGNITSIFSDENPNACRIM